MSAFAPRPTVDEESAPYWRGLVEHRLLLQRCRACGRHRFPPMPSCPWCAATAADTVEATGEGSVYSWVTVHRPLSPAFAQEVPYTIAAVELAERCRVMARVEGPGALTAGTPVVAAYVDHDGWTELRFTAGTAT